MPETSETNVMRRVVVTEERDRPTRLLVWAVVFTALMLVAMLAYAAVTGTFSNTAPRTAQEDALASTAEAIRQNPNDGKQYAIRAETLHQLGETKQAFAVLDQGEKAAANENPGLLYVLRARTALLNAEGRYAEAVRVGTRAMTASDDYLGEQGLKLAKKGVTGITGNVQTQLSVDTAIQVAAAYAGLKKWDKAIEMYDYALRLDPLAGDILSLRGWAHLDAGNKAKAKADFQQSLKYLPDDAAALQGMKQLSN